MTQTKSPSIKEFDWKLWLVDNLYRGVEPELLKNYLVSQGLKATSVQHELNALGSNPAFRAAGRFIHAARRIQSIDARMRRLEAYRKPFTIERKSGLSVEAFYRDYVAANTPVILTDVIQQWPALQRWTPAYLREKFGNERVQIMTGRDADPSYMPNQDKHMSEISMATYVDMVEQNSPTNDFYMVARNRNLEKETMQALRDDLQPLPAIMAPDSRPDSYLLWFGPAGTRTPLHHDPNSVLFCQIYGRKRYWMVQPGEMSLILNEDGFYSPIDVEAPDLNRYPELQSARVHTFEIAPGEALFIPQGWWHQVRSLDIAISVTLDEFRKPGDPALAGG